jgi:hypothetical protein
MMNVPMAVKYQNQILQHVMQKTVSRTVIHLLIQRSEVKLDVDWWLLVIRSVCDSEDSFPRAQKRDSEDFASFSPRLVFR